MKTLMLFGFVTMAICSSAKSEELPGLISLFDQFIGGYASCVSYCVSSDAKVIESRLTQTCQPTVEAIAKSVKGDSYEMFYTTAFQRSGSKTQMCTWAESVMLSCVTSIIGNCRGSAGKFYETIKKDILQYVCSIDPPVLECVMSPTLINKADAISSCTNSLVDKFGRHFKGSDPRNIFDQLAKFYYQDVEPNNGATIYSEFQGMTGCISGKVQLFGSDFTGGSCASTRKAIDKEVNSIIAYVKKTDMLSCGLHPSLIQKTKTCVETLVKDVDSDPNFNTGTTSASGSPFITALMNKEYYKFKGHWLKVRGCLLRSVDNVCGKKWVYTALEIQMKAVDSFLDNDRVAPDYCDKLSKVPEKSGESLFYGGWYRSGTTKMAVANMVLLVLGAALSVSF